MNERTFDVADCVARVRLDDQDAARTLVDYLYPNPRQELFKNSTRPIPGTPQSRP